jgi:hypothetical protein
MKDILQFVKAIAQWLPPNSQINSHVWDGTPQDTFFPDLLLAGPSETISLASFHQDISNLRISTCG